MKKRGAIAIVGMVLVVVLLSEQATAGYADVTRISSEGAFWGSAIATGTILTVGAKIAWQEAVHNPRIAEWMALAIPGAGTAKIAKTVIKYGLLGGSAALSGYLVAKGWQEVGGQIVMPDPEQMSATWAGDPGGVGIMSIRCSPGVEGFQDIGCRSGTDPSYNMEIRINPAVKSCITTFGGAL